MKILLESTNSQTLTIIPRSYPALVDIILTREDTDTPVTLSDIDTITDAGHLSVNTVFDLKEDNFYSFEVTSSGETIFKGKIFCTNQTPVDYTINDGEYVSRPKNNKYVMYGDL